MHGAESWNKRRRARLKPHMPRAKAPQAWPLRAALLVKTRGVSQRETHGDKSQSKVSAFQEEEKKVRQLCSCRVDSRVLCTVEPPYAEFSVPSFSFNPFPYTPFIPPLASPSLPSPFTPFTKAVGPWSHTLPRTPFADRKSVV